ncbi:hypothetical protein V6N13_127409 [Hibiscus sabdariffa]
MSLGLQKETATHLLKHASCSGVADTVADNNSITNASSCSTLNSLILLVAITLNQACSSQLSIVFALIGFFIPACSSQICVVVKGLQVWECLKRKQFDYFGELVWSMLASLQALPVVVIPQMVVFVTCFRHVDQEKIGKCTTGLFWIPFAFDVKGWLVAKDRARVFSANWSC